MELPVFLWIILGPLLASPLIYLCGHLFSRRSGLAAQVCGVLAMVGAWVAYGLTAYQFNLSGSMNYTLGSVTLCLDGVSLLLAAVALGLGTMVMLFSGPYLAVDSGPESGQVKYYAVLSALVGVMIGLACACDLFNLWIWFEAMAVSSYLLVAYYKDQAFSLEAGVKYLVQSAAGSVLVLLGISLVLSQTGSLDLSEIKAASQDSPLLLVAGALFLIGFGVKAALVPMHTWLPDAHSQAPSGISAMLSGVVIEAGLIAMLRSVAPLIAFTNLWGQLLMGFGAINMLVGNLMALRQRHVKRLLAYSSLVHLGYMLIGVGVAVYYHQVTGMEGGLFHLFNHGMMKALAFLAAGTLLYSLHLATGDHDSPLTIEDLSGASRRYPLVAVALSLALLGLGGIPPLSGFMSKWQILVAGLETRNLFVGFLVVFAALNSVLSLAYYTPLVNTVYKREQSPVVIAGRAIPAVMSVPLVLLAVVVVLVGLYPSMMAWLTQPAGADLLAAFSP